MSGPYFFWNLLYDIYVFLMDCLLIILYWFHYYFFLQSSLMWLDLYVEMPCLMLQPGNEVSLAAVYCGGCNIQESGLIKDCWDSFDELSFCTWNLDNAAYWESFSCGMPIMCSFIMQLAYLWSFNPAGSTSFILSSVVLFPFLNEVKISMKDIISMPDKWFNRTEDNAIGRV